MANKLAHSINTGYRARYTRKPQKGIGVYAEQLPGVGPRGLHVPSGRGTTCRCGGCEGRRKHEKA